MASHHYNAAFFVTRILPMSSLISVTGIVVLFLIGWLFSSHRSAIRPRTVFGAFVLQFLIGAFVLFVPAGRNVLFSVSDFVSHILSFSHQGVEFLFGALVSPKMFEVFGGSGFIFAFRVLPVIIFVASLMSVLYYTGIMTAVIRVIGGTLTYLLGISRTESLSATANIFVGYTEAPLVIRPYISTMTRSELFAVMTGGLASCSGSTLAGYAAMGIPMHYLIAASFMAAPAGLVFAKLMEPETETPTMKIEKTTNTEKPSNVIEAAANGATDGLKLALNIGALLLSFIALIALINATFGAIGGWFGYPNMTLQQFLGWVFSPITFLLGVPSSELSIVAPLIGEKTILNEFVAFMHLGPYITGSATELSEVSKAVATFALCGFANISSVAVLIGGLGSLAPNRKHDVVQMGLRAILAGSLANLMSAAIAGFFVSLSVTM